MRSFLFRTLLILIHSLYSLVDFIYKFWVYIITFKLYHEEPVNYEVNYLKLKIIHLTKIPSHIVIIIGTEQPSYKDLARVIIWCIASGITFISLYDYKGVLKKSDKILQNAVIDRRKDFMDEIVWNKYDVKTNGYKNGQLKVKKFYVNIFSYMNGRRDLVNIAKQLAEYDLNSELDVQLLDKYICNSLKLPEPDLGIICGDYFCTYGLLPWHIRTTEFLRIDTHHSIRVETFYKLLTKYSRCEQRYGK